MAESIYGHWETTLTRIMEKIVGYFESYNKQCKESLGEPAYEHLNFRIKSEKSMRDKCRRRGLPETTESALCEIQDAIGIRVVCCFLDDVYDNVRLIKEAPNCRIVREKDYIKNTHTMPTSRKLEWI